jgi:hypothetical protein
MKVSRNQTRRTTVGHSGGRSAETEICQPQVREGQENRSEFFPHVKERLAATVSYGTGRQAYDPDERIFGKIGTYSENGARPG